VRPERCGQLPGGLSRPVEGGFVAKLGISVEEADETAFWIEFAVESGLVKMALVKDLMDETEEILAILVSSRKTAGRA
jgi:four helix bundle protein